jgi:hypothetical protein
LIPTIKDSKAANLNRISNNRFTVNVLVEYQYFPPSILVKRLVSSTHLVFEQYERFQKMSFRNRLQVAGSSGPLLLSIPLRNGRDQKAFTRQVLIDNRTSWQAIHFKSLVSCYNRSPWFEFFREDLNGLYETRCEFLVEWNLICWNWVIEKLGLSLPVRMTDAWEEKYDPEDWDDWRNSLLPKTIQSKFPDAPRYRQVFMDRTGFIPHLSILDLLFCEGKNAVNILRQQ